MQYFWLPSLGVNGSPPRAWGLFAWSRVVAALTTVHPHVRGAYWNMVIVCTNECGSPPRAWGLCSMVLGGMIKSRFTPTCVGLIFNNGDTVLKAAVHPHVRGAYYKKI